MNKVFFMIGIPGSGKSTFAREIYEYGGVRVYVCPDDIRERLTGSPEDFTHEGQVWDLVKMQLSYAARTGNDVVLDATGANAKLRREMVSWLKSVGSHILGMYVKVDLAVALERNAKRLRKVPDPVIARMYRNLNENPPSLSEGFDHIMEIG